MAARKRVFDSNSNAICPHNSFPYILVIGLLRSKSGEIYARPQRDGQLPARVGRHPPGDVSCVASECTDPRRRIFDGLERYIRTYPEQWYCFYPFWEDPSREPGRETGNEKRKPTGS